MRPAESDRTLVSGTVEEAITLSGFRSDDLKSAHSEHPEPKVKYVSALIYSPYCVDHLRLTFTPVFYTLLSLRSRGPRQKPPSHTVPGSQGRVKKMRAHFFNLYAKCILDYWKAPLIANEGLEHYIILHLERKNIHPMTQYGHNWLFRTVYLKVK